MLNNGEPAPDFSGNDTFTYEATDGLDSSIGTVTITVENVNDPPTALNDSYEVNQGETLDVNEADGVLANDSDPDPTPPETLTAQRISGPTSGMLTLNSNGVLPDMHIRDINDHGRRIGRAVSVDHAIRKRVAAEEATGGRVGETAI